MKLMRIQATDSSRAREPFCDAEVADSPLKRFLGLQFRASLPEGRGLLLVPCRHIHMFGVRFPIDVIRLDAQGRVICVDLYVEPWQVSMGPKETHAVLEVPGATAYIHAGDWLRLDDAANAPRSLSFLTGPVDAPAASTPAKPAAPPASSASSVPPVSASSSNRSPASEGNNAGFIDDVSHKVIHV